MNIPDFGIPMLTKHCNEVLILANLFQDKKHGYQLALDIEKKSEGLFKLNHGTMYPILHKLEKGGLIKGIWRQEGPRRKRKYYSLTAKGKRYAQSQVQEWNLFFKHFFSVLKEIRE